MKKQTNLPKFAKWDKVKFNGNIDSKLSKFWGTDRIFTIMDYTETEDWFSYDIRDENDMDDTYNDIFNVDEDSLDIVDEEDIFSDLEFEWEKDWEELCSVDWDKDINFFFWDRVVITDWDGKCAKAEFYEWCEWIVVDIWENDVKQQIEYKIKILDKLFDNEDNILWLSWDYLEDII